MGGHLGVTLNNGVGIEDIKIYITNHRGIAYPLKEGDFIKKDGELNNIYRMEKPEVGMGGEVELLGQWFTIQDSEIIKYGHYDFMIYTHCNYLGEKMAYLLARHTLVSQKELVKFGLATNTMDFIFGGDND